MKADLFEHLKRLLEYSGGEVKEIHKTVDGATALISLDGEPHRVYVAPVRPKDCILDDSFNYEY